MHIPAPKKGFFLSFLSNEKMYVVLSRVCVVLCRVLYREPG